jgi:class 3 adenylate cyclase
MAAIKAQPIPGGPHITNPTVVKAAAVSTADIERFDRLAKSTGDRELARYYADRVRELKAAQN